jgi:ABC-type multidrug transport system fused ATPase/permease subunit|tara:strand:- start:59 stop:2008 length:1950 start_codon:yes stop_codon:yes gene_type:complete
MPMADSFSSEDAKSFSFEQLREEELALNRKASLVDTRTDIDNRQTGGLIWRILLLLRFFWQRFAVVLSMEWILAAVAAAVAPWAGKVLIDHVVLGQPIPDDGRGYPSFLLPAVEFLTGSSALTILFWLAIWTAVGVAARLVWEYVHDLVEERLQHSMMYMLRARLFESMRRLPITQLDNQPIGDSVFRTIYDVSSVTHVIRLVFQVTGNTLVTFTVAALTMLSAYPDSPMVVWLALGVMPVYVLVTLPFSRMIRHRAQATVAAGTVFTSATEEGMDNIQAVQSLGVNDLEKERFGLTSANAFRRERYEMLANGAIEGLGEFAGKVLYLGFMLYMLGVVISGEMTPGDYAVILGYFLTMSEPAKSLGGLWLNIQGPAAKARRVFAMLDMDSEDDVGTVAMETVSEGIEFQQVGFTYPDGRVALSNVSFEARQGEMVALAGPTGAGKTTLAYLVPRYHVATQGRILVDGRNINEFAIDSLRSQVTYVFQEAETLAISVADNIRFGNPEATQQEVERVARLVGIHDFIADLPEGYQTLLGTTSSKLSVGQKQRLSIARGLIRDTAVLILDEPTSALDPETENYLASALREAAKEKLVIVIAHRLSTIRQADKVVFLEHGQVVEQGTHDELMNLTSGRYREFVNLQEGASAND